MRKVRGRSSVTSRPLAGVGFLATILGFGAFNASCSSSGSECQSNRTFFEENVWSSFMGTQCTKCHAPDGIAHTEHNAKFILQPSSYPGFIDANLANLAEIAQIQQNGTSELLLKPIGQMNHVGGVQIEEGSTQYKALTELVDRLGKSGSTTCTEPPSTTLSAVKTVETSSTLRKAALHLVGRLPTATESASVTKGGDAALDKALDAMMKEDAFYTRLREIWNDILLTDRFLSYDGAAIDNLNVGDDMNPGDYPGLKPYRDSTSTVYNNRGTVNRAIAREPLDLIAYIVKNGKPFTDVVEANYTVVNPFTAIAYNLQLQFKDPTDYNEFQEAQVTLGSGVQIPHAGVLSAPMFLNRWPTSPTNRNRARARRVFQFFLATDVLKIATRPVDATAVTAEENPTRNSEYCVVCHRAIDPVAGGFRGYDDYNYAHFDPKTAWHDEMFQPGFGDNDMDPAYYTKALQWLGPQVAQDPRFIISAVRTVYKGLTGHDVLPYPPDNTDPAFTSQLAAWRTQDSFFQATASAFSKGNYDLKLIFKAVIKSPYYRAVSAPAGTDAATLADVGTGRLLTPEMLNRKIAAILGYRWRKTYDWANQHDYLVEDYDILYGGIDSNATISRLTAPNGIISAVAGRMANETACATTAWDFAKGKSERTLFPLVDLTEQPESSGHTVDGSVSDIKKNIQHLHQLLLDEKLALTDPEIERTYQLFLDTWHELEQAGDGNLEYNCSGRWDPNTGEDLPMGVQITDDKNYTVRSWMAVVSYLLSDFKFIYE